MDATGMLNSFVLADQDAEAWAFHASKLALSREWK
jgi:hypothetical protein